MVQANLKRNIKKEYWTEIRKCAYCGQEFEWFSNKPNQKYCSSECSMASNKIKKEVWSEIRKCAYCGQEFEWFSNKSSQKYCSYECLLSSNTKRVNKEVWSEIRKCAYCGQEFEWSSNKSNQKYCCSECTIIANKEKNKQEVWSEIRKCAHCGKEFEWSSNKSNQKYCGLECRQEATAIKSKNYPKKSKNKDEELRNIVYFKVLDIIRKMNQSQGNTFNGAYIDYSSVGDISDKTRAFVLERDGYECQICRRKDSLQLHHLIKRKNGGNHKAENLVTLCASCHRHVETGDVEHATNKCFKNAKRYYDAVKSHESLEIDVDNLRSRLIVLFDKLKESAVSEDTEIMVCLDEALELLDK